MPHFGPAVIGQKAYDEQDKVEKSGSLRFGPAVLDPHRAKRDADARAMPHGSPGDATQPVLPGTQGPVEADIESFSVREVKRLLEGESNPAAINRLMLAEFQRPDGARKSALDAILKAENRLPNPREEVVAAIEQKLTEVS